MTLSPEVIRYVADMLRQLADLLDPGAGEAAE